MPLPPAETKLLYVLGFGRSGSTILDMVLGELPGFFSAGELQSLWEGALIEGRLCGCGAHVDRCRVWAKILGSSADDALGMSPEDVVALQREQLRLHRLGSSLGSRAQKEEQWNRYGSILADLYRRIADVTGARVIVDSSKLPSVAPLLDRLVGIEPYLVQLVRDPRAVAHSWKRRKPAADRISGGELERFGVLRSVATWTARQAAAEIVRRRTARPSLLLRYEDFIASPAETVVRISELLGEDRPDTSFISGSTVRVGPNHTVSGNPVRLDHGTLVLHEDEEWKNRLSTSARAAVTTLSLPLLQRYDYVRFGSQH